MRPEFQIINKMIGRRILAPAEAAGVVAAEQHGSWKFRKAINTYLNNNKNQRCLSPEEEGRCCGYKRCCGLL